MDSTVLMHVSRVQYSFITDVPFQFVQSQLMELTYATVMHSTGLLVMVDSMISLFIDQTVMILGNTMLFSKASSHLDLVVKKCMVVMTGIVQVRGRVLVTWNVLA